MSSKILPNLAQQVTIMNESSGWHKVKVGKISYLHTIKRLSDLWGIFHFEEGAQVSSCVVELYLKTFVSKSDLTADSN